MRNFIPGNSYNIVYLNLSRYLSFREITVISIENNILKAFDSISNEIRSFNLKRLKIINSIESKTIDEEI
tara:strand:- start:7 stop:216 length:210 start_codon:yes stop_codon:yes gene_type:complete